MATIIFYEKPGCINNTKQKKLLKNAGHEVNSRDLLKEAWSRETLLKYFDGMIVSSWFNMSAPDIKSGEVDPAGLDKEAALELMIQNPILIRRPLMQVAEEYRVGFDAKQVDQWIGLEDISTEDDLESCPQKQGHHCD